MKMNITKIYSVIAILFLLLSSCEKDDSLDPRPIIVQGQYITLTNISKKVFYDNVPTSNFEGVLKDPSGKVVKYNLYVRLKDQNGILGQYKLLKTITSFPHQLIISRDEIATALGVPVSALLVGGLYNFWGESFDANNTKTDFNSLSTVVKSNSSLQQGFRFKTQSLTNTPENNPPTNVLTNNTYTDFDNYTEY
jgi:hypothetical protein